MEFTVYEIYFISKVFQNYYCAGIEEIAENEELAASIFRKLGLITEGE